MAQFCTKCGAPQSEGMKFCLNCGAAIGEPPAPAAQAPAMQAPVVQPVAAVAPAPAPSSGSPVLKIVLIVLAVLVLIGLLSIGSCVYFVYRAKQRVTQFEKQIHANFPVATATQPSAPGQVAGGVTGPGPAVDAGDLPYPGATPAEGGGEMSMGVGGVKVQQYTTSDSADKVVAYYRNKLGSQAMVTESAGSALVQVVGSNGMVNIAIAPDSSSGKTKITINSITK